MEVRTWELFKRDLMVVVIYFYFSFVKSPLFGMEILIVTCLQVVAFSGLKVL